MRALILAALLAGPALADPATVVDVAATPTGATWRFDVTLLHPDTGWDHYADGWEIVDADGTVLASRPLAHPHETEQPFTRSVGGVTLPAGLARVYLRTRCNRDGWHPAQTAVTLP